MAVASMLVGNLLALSQKNFKRFLAYSSIAQAGYILVGVAASSNLGATGVLYYLMAYLATNMAAFGIAFLIARATGSDDIAGLAGLSRQSPILGMALLISLLSLGGIPPFAGFIGKFIVFSAAIQSGYGLAGDCRRPEFCRQSLLLFAGSKSCFPEQTVPDKSCFPGQYPLASRVYYLHCWNSCTGRCTCPIVQLGVRCSIFTHPLLTLVSR